MKRVTLPAIVGLLVIAGGTAQAQILTGNIVGAVKDESGGFLPGVTVTLTSPALPAGPMTVVTSPTGEYRFTLLAPGSYALRVNLSGFSTYQEDGLLVTVGGTIERIVSLKLASVAETITVSGETPMVDPRQVGVTANLDVKEIETLPRNRNALHELVKWSPGVSPSDPSGGGGGSVMGAGANENAFVWDGIVSNLPASGGNWSSGDVDAAGEVQILTLGASAEYQVAQGAVFNIVFKQGTNDWKFDGSSYWYPDSLLSKPIKVNCNCPLGQTGFTNELVRIHSFHAGGPIKKDRLWFFGGGNYDGRRQGNPGTDPTRLPTLWYSHAVMTKVTWQINRRLSFNGLYHQDPWGGQSRPTVARPFETQAPAYSPGEPSYRPELNATLSDNTLLSIRAFGWAEKNEDRPFTGDRVTPFRLDASSGIACCGVQSFGYQYNGRFGEQAKMNHYLKRGSVTHDVRYGVQFERGHVRNLNAFPSGVQYSDLNGQPDQASFRAPYVRGAEYGSQGVWGENQMTFGGRLSISVGARFDRMKGTSPDLPAINNLAEETGGTVAGLGDLITWNAFAPRVGYNLKVTDDGKTVLRGHYARAYRQIILNDFQDLHSGLSPTTLARWNPATNSYSTIISVTSPNANLTLDRGLDAPLTDAFSVGMDRELIANLGVGVTYVHKRGQQQIGWRDIGGVYGTRTEVLPDGRTLTVFPLLNATSARKFERTNGPGTFNRYHGIILTMDKRWSHRWRSSLSYTYSKSEGLTTTQQDPNGDINAAGRLNLDRPQMFSAMGMYEIPKIDVQLAANFMGVSGTPFAPQALVQLPQGRLSINIEEPTGKYRLPSQQLLDFRVTKMLFRRGDRRIELSAEVNNALQDQAHSNITTATFFASNFATPSSWIEPRRMNLVLRYAF